MSSLRCSSRIPHKIFSGIFKNFKVAKFGQPDQLDPKLAASIMTIETFIFLLNFL